MKDRSENKRISSSIARKINAHYWVKRFFGIFFLNLLIILVVLGTYASICESKISEKKSIFNFMGTDTGVDYRRIDFNDDDKVVYVIGLTEGEKMVFYPAKDLSVLYPGAAIICSFELLYLFLALFEASEVRRRLKPLNDLAIQAEEFSRMSFDPVSNFDQKKIENLEHAIERVSPDAPDARIETGDGDLLSIEVAINNLIRHMKETQQQQSRFVSDASHELRTPIAVIQGYVNMLDRWGKEDESVLEESIEALKNESEHMKELIEQLLFLARGDSGRNTLNKTDVDLNELMSEVYDESVMIDEKHNYTYKPAPLPRVFTGDIAMIKQSARIFIQNAAKYSPDHGTINIKVINDDEYVSYIIQDEGIGMSENEVSHIFERFYRSDEARNGETGGSGLGLSIAKWIVDAHNGVIDVLSRPEIGTRFTIRFPLH